MKFLKIFIESLYWLNIFIVPVGVLGCIGFVIHHHYSVTWSLVLFVFLIIAGTGLGVYWAEWARRTMGCSVFVNSIFWSRDIDEAISSSNKDEEK